MKQWLTTQDSKGNVIHYNPKVVYKYKGYTKYKVKARPEPEIDE